MSQAGEPSSESSERLVSSSMQTDTIVYPQRPQENEPNSMETDYLHSDEDIFRLAAATPVPLAPTIEKRFHNSLLLLYVLERVRGEHSKRQSYHGELEQDSAELRRSFIDKLAYICDFRKGGSTVTAVALQKTYQGVTFWLAANETVKPKVTEFLREVLETLKKTKDQSDMIEKQLIQQIVAFNEERLDFYWSIVSMELDSFARRLFISKNLVVSHRCSDTYRHCVDLVLN